MSTYDVSHPRWDGRDRIANLEALVASIQAGGSPRSGSFTPPAAWLTAWGSDYADVFASPVTVTVTGAGRPYASLSYDARGLFNSRSTALSAPQATYYVATTGSDGNNGLTAGAPFQHIWYAVNQANSGGVPATIVVAAGNYYRTSTPWWNNGSGVSPTVDIAFLASGGRVVSSTSDPFSDPSLDGTYGNCYAVAVTNGTIDRIVDTTNLNQWGAPTELVNRPTAALANAIPGSWFQTGGTVYIHRLDDIAVTKLNTRIYRSQTSNLLLTNAANVFVGGLTAADSWVLEGGDTDGTVSSFPAASQATLKVAVFDHCIFRHGGGIVNTSGKCVGFNSFHGLAAFFRCHSTGGYSDGFNFHNSHANTARWLCVNCTSTDQGRFPSNSCNHYTSHEDAVGATICCYGEASHGGSWRFINTSQTWSCADTVRDDYGDIAFAGSVSPTAFRVDDTAKLWIDSDEVVFQGGGIAHDSSSAGTVIYLRNSGPTILPNRATGTIGSY